MTNKIALILGAIIVAALIADQVIHDGQGAVFLGRKLVLLIEYVAFWR
ncbi:hypothetical protein SAMN04487859_10797 [Roseovarius lutimaris]|uniref:Glyceraldehyde-3-phosphate dehydrogenase n=1 Tax=Roseovarius lutimaris TaxID=1005928 RepID=A0A1I5B774_9RHOB|nr:hypothetical protein [Roseovarius lutimaris]SFN70470.1 hypothetical protein SAMN04487859_10797 [Roseovarius lutimaris]